MGEWKRIKLSEVLKEKTERNKNNKTDLVLSVTNSQGFMKQSDFFEGTVHSEDISNYKLVRKNEFAYNPSRINVGSIDILKEYDIGALSPMYVIFSVDETKLLPDYFKYYFQTHKFNENVKNNTQGSVRNSLSFKALSEFEYLLPPLEEQKRMVKILDQVNKIIEKYQNLINEKEQFIKSQFVEMFGSINERVKMSECCKKITDYVASGSFASLHENVKTYDTENYAIMVKTADFANGFTKGLTYTDEQGYNFLHNSNLHGGELLLSNIGASIGKVHRVPKLTKKMTLAPNSIMIITNELYIEDYLQYYFLSDEGQKVLKSMETATAMPKFNKTQLKDIKIPKVELNEQLKFSKVIQLIDKQKFELEKQKQNYIDLKKGLMQQLLTGKLRVS